ASSKAARRAPRESGANQRCGPSGNKRGKSAKTRASDPSRLGALHSRAGRHREESLHVIVKPGGEHENPRLPIQRHCREGQFGGGLAAEINRELLAVLQFERNAVTVVSEPKP